MKEKLKAALTDPGSKYFFFASDALAVVTIISVVAVVLETVPSLSDHIHVFNFIEWVAVAIFTIEYLARLYISNPRWKYPVSFFGIIDLVSILPTFLGVGNLTFLKSARALRVVRLLRLVRLAKLSHLHKAHSDESLGAIGLNTLIFFVVLVLALLLSGTLIYLFETGVEAFTSIPAGMWWSFQVFMGGIPVAEPLSALGGVVYVFSRFLGFILIGVLVGVVGNILRVMLLK